MSHPRKIVSDALNRPATQTQPDGTVIAHTYNEAGLLETVKKDSQIYVSNINYNEKGQRDAIYYGNGSKTSYEYDSNTFRLKKLLTTRNGSTDALQDLNYIYDPVGNIVEVIDNALETTYYNNAPVYPTKQYTYDALYRLKSGNGRELAGLAMASAGDYFTDNTNAQDLQAVHQFTQKYSYDQLGNIEEIKHTVATDPTKNWTRSYEYDEDTNKLLKHDSAQTIDDYTYDNHGNITSMPHLSEMEWDHGDMLIKTKKGTEYTYYKYDASGERVRKVTVKQNNDVVENLYFGNYEIYREIDDGNTSSIPDKERQTVHISDNTKRIALIEKLTIDGGNTITNPLEVVRYQMDDHLGSACVELNENAEIISYEEYHPFGTTSYQKHSSNISQKRYRYVGKEKDTETGLYYYGARYYAGWIGRFISTDPIAGERSWVNPYNYVQNNPINRIDPDGALDDDPPKGNLVPTPINDIEGISAPTTLKDNTNIIAGQPPKEILKPPKQLETFKGIPLGEVREQISALTLSLQAGANQVDKKWISGNNGSLFLKSKDPRLSGLSSKKVLNADDVVKLEGSKKLVRLNNKVNKVSKNIGRIGTGFNLANTGYNVLEAENSWDAIGEAISGVGGEILSRKVPGIALLVGFTEMVMDDPKFNKMKVREYEQKVEQYRFGDSKKFENAKRNLIKYKNKVDPNRNRIDNRQYEFKQN